MLKKIFVICTFFFLNLISAQPPEGFVYLSDLIPDVEVELRYFGDHNFTGRPVPGYDKRKIILTTEAAKALAEAQQELEKDGYCLNIFDAYRPQTAVNSFIEWAKNPGDTLTKVEFYPEKKKRHDRSCYQHTTPENKRRRHISVHYCTGFGTDLWKL